MNLRKKKELAAKTLKVGKNRLIFDSEKLSEIKEAITRQDIKDLYEAGAISIKPIKGRKKIIKRKTRRGPGKIRKTLNKRKSEYVIITRRLRYYIRELKKQNKINQIEYKTIRKKIKMRVFKNTSQLKDYLQNKFKAVKPARKKK
jgi:large subunit ribosomal protein L19e